MRWALVWGRLCPPLLATGCCPLYISLSCHELFCWQMSFADSVSSSAGTLPTLGGGVVDVFGSNLGLTSSAVTLRYAGGSLGMAHRRYSAGACVVVSPGTHIQCPAAPGVGANYTFTVEVEGGMSTPSVDTVSYGTPIITSVEGPGALECPAAGGVPIFLRGVR